MYLYHYGLRQLPFTLTPNTQFFLGLPSHHEALQVLLTAVKTGEGFIKVTGEVGTGKTLLCRKLLNELPNDFICAYIPNPYLQPEELRIAVAQELGIDCQQAQTQQKITQDIQQKVMELSAQGKSLVLILDEAQTLPEQSIETLRLFTNLETESRKLIQVVMFGQPELDEVLAAPQLRQVKQRITFSYCLRCLNKAEVAPYLSHRLNVAGYQGLELFNKQVSEYLFKASEGVPRLLNILAHKCLMLCFGEGGKEVSLAQAKQAVSDTESITPAASLHLSGKRLASLLGFIGSAVLLALLYWHRGGGS